MMIDWLTFSVLVILIGYFLNVLKYMLGSFVRDESLKASATDGVIYLVISLLLFSLVLPVRSSFSSNMLSATDILETSLEDSLYCQADAYGSVSLIQSLGGFSFWINAGKMLATKGGTSSSSNKNINNQASAEGFHTFGAGRNPLAISFSLYSLIAPFVSVLNLMLTLVNLPYVFGFLQLKILKIFSSIGFKVLFPVGIAFRSFSSIRGIGNLLIAIFVAYYIFYPFLVLLERDFLFSLASPFIPSDSDWASITVGVIRTLFCGISTTVVSFVAIPIHSPFGSIETYTEQFQLCDPQYISSKEFAYNSACRLGLASADSIVFPILASFTKYTLPSFVDEDIQYEGLEVSSNTGESVFNTVKANSQFISSFSSADSNDDSNKPFVSLLLYVFRVNLEVMLFPILNNIFALGFARSLARMLGSDVDLSSLVRVV